MKIRDYVTLSKDVRAEQRWERAQARWDQLGPWTRIYALAEHLMVKAEKEGKLLGADEACKLARQRVEAGPLFEAAGA